MEISIKWNVCRVCLEEEMPQNIMKEIFTASVLAKRIYECSGIKMCSSDGLPEKICQKCLLTLKHAISFRTKCRQSDEYLRKVVEKTKSTTLFESGKKVNDDDVDPFDMIEEVLEEASEEPEAQELEENNQRDFHYTADLLENFSSQKSASNESLKNNQLNLKNTVKSMPIKNEKINYKPLLKIKNPEKELSNVKSLQPHELHDHEENNGANDIKINLNLVDRKDKGKQDTPSSEVNINHVIDSDNKSTYHVEFIDTEKEDIRDADDDDTCVVRKKLRSLDNKKQSFKIETQTDIQLKKELDKEDKTENYYVVVEEDKNEQEFESDDEMREVLHKTSTDSVEQSEQAEFVDVPNEEESEFVLGIGDELSNEHIMEYNGYTESQSVPSNSEDIMSSDIDAKEKPAESNSHKKFKGRRERKHLEKKIFPKSSKLRGKDTDSLVCETCGNNFTCRTSLKSHLRMHRRDKYHECELCSKRFTAACNLTAHMRTHTGEKPYACQFCDRRFADRSTHIKHERTHTNEKPFQCTVCLKSFSLSTSLRAHELVHTDEKRHSCLHCKKAFKLPHQLKAHFKTQLHKIVVNDLNSIDGEQSD